MAVLPRGTISHVTHGHPLSPENCVVLLSVITTSLIKTRLSCFLFLKLLLYKALGHLNRERGKGIALDIHLALSLLSDACSSLGV